MAIMTAMNDSHPSGDCEERETSRKEQEIKLRKSMKRENLGEMETGVLGCHVWGYDWFEVLALPSTTTHVCQCVFCVCGCGMTYDPSVESVSIFVVLHFPFFIFLSLNLTFSLSLSIYYSSLSAPLSLISYSRFSHSHNLSPLWPLLPFALLGSINFH